MSGEVAQAAQANAQAAYAAVVAARETRAQQKLQTEDLLVNTQGAVGVERVATEASETQASESQESQSQQAATASPTERSTLTPGVTSPSPHAAVAPNLPF